MELRLSSPVGGSPAIYQWPLCKKKGYDGAKEIIETIIWGCKDIPDLSVPLKKNILTNVDTNSFESMKALTKRYNKAINNVLSLEKGTQKFCDRLNQIPSRELLHHIIQQTYSAAVTNAEELNRYQAFSPDVYGETSFDLINQMIDKINLSKDDIFIDLGSGVGQVILQVAATSLCKECIGIERADVPAKYAEAMEERFKFWLQWYGKECGNFKLIKDDFFDEAYRDKFNEATVIFVNNFAFGPSVDHRLKERFAEMKHGTKIVSSKSFCPLNFRISDRNLSDIGTIMNVSEISPNTSSVSWTDKPVSFFLHVIDRTKLEKYFQDKKNGTLQPLPNDDAETSSDSFETDSDKNLEINPPPKKRRRKSKPKNIECKKHDFIKTSDCIGDINKSTQKSVKVHENSKVSTNHRDIIRPSKLILDRSKELNLNKPNPKRGRKRKDTSRSCSTDFTSNNWFSQGNLRINSKTSNDNIKPVNPFVNNRKLSLQSNLKRLLDNFKLEYLQAVDEMSDPFYKLKIRKQIDEEVKRHGYLKLRIAKLNQEIEDIVVLMQRRFFEAAVK